MRIGLDIDGVLANFSAAYQRLVVSVAGVDRFHPNDINDQPCWDWPEMRGYAATTMKTVWGIIIRSQAFWYGLEPHADNLASLALLLPDLEHKHDVYYCTNRPGVRAKRQTEAWLMRWLPYTGGITPTVLICGNKAAAAAALSLDVYVDDNWDNALGVSQVVNPKTFEQLTRTYLLDRSYNRHGDTLGPAITRVSSLAQLFDTEIANL